MNPDSYRLLWLSLIENKPYEGMFINKHKNGTEFYEYKTITPVLDEEQRPMYYIAISRDATDTTIAIDKLSYLAQHDELTGLYNRAKFNDILAQKKSAYQQTCRSFSLILGDIDDFKKINDVYGHDIGDKVLKSVAEKLTHLIRHDDFVARWGGEEFVLLVDCNLDDAMKIAQTLVRNLAAINKDGIILEQQVSLSFGVATYVADMTLEQLFDQADQALYRAKADGKNCARSI
jgi:diguanylate cyclase (GGDEF)-like protein